MKQLITLFILFISSVTFSQTIFLKNDHYVEGKFIFRTDQFLYLQRNDSIYRIDTADVKFIQGTFDHVPNTTYQSDLYIFTKKGRNAMNLYLTGFLVTTVGTAFLASSDTEGVALFLAGTGAVIGISGFFTQMSAWKFGKRGMTKMVAKPYLLSR